ncbi:MAG: ATP-binding protein [bacterium]|nr:ATP-binding protein [bacterium]
MLISFEVENFLSVKESQELSMIASSDTDMANTHCLKPGTEKDLTLLKSAAIYGANASGKSNLVKALLFMRDFILTSTSGEKISLGTGFQPFILDKESHKQPGCFEADILIGKEIFTYGFQIDDQKVLSEWLYFYPHKTRALLFERELSEKEADRVMEKGATGPKYEYRYKFGSYFKGEKNRIVSLTRSNALYLTVGAQFANPVLEKVFHWFKDYMRPGISPESEPAGDFTTQFIENNEDAKKRIVSFLKSADLGIEDLRVEKPENGKGNGKPFDIKMTHRAVSGEEHMSADIDFRSESLGTQRMYRLAGPLFYTLINGGVLIIDELEDSLHLHLLKAMLAEFFENSTPAQIIFTTHNVQLLEERLFRRDEIWFTEKRADGVTVLFSLADFKPGPSKDKSLKNVYLNGALGALPLLGDLLSE